MKKLIIVLYCFIRGHNYIPLYSLNNSDIYNGVWQSVWGCSKCMRCGKEEHWQWDR